MMGCLSQYIVHAFLILSSICYVVPPVKAQKVKKANQDAQKEHQAKQTPALATLLYVDWHNREVVRHRQVNGPPGALPPKSVDHKNCANID